MADPGGWGLWQCPALSPWLRLCELFTTDTPAHHYHASPDDELPGFLARLPACSGVSISCRGGRRDRGIPLAAGKRNSRPQDFFGRRLRRRRTGHGHDAAPARARPPAAIERRLPFTLGRLDRLWQLSRRRFLLHVQPGG